MFRLDTPICTISLIIFLSLCIYNLVINRQFFCSRFLPLFQLRIFSYDPFESLTRFYIVLHYYSDQFRENGVTTVWIRYYFSYFDYQLRLIKFTLFALLKGLVLFYKIGKSVIYRWRYSPLTFIYKAFFSVYVTFQLFWFIYLSYFDLPLGSFIDWNKVWKKTRFPWWYQTFHPLIYRILSFLFWPYFSISTAKKL